MKITIEPSIIKGNILAPPSKSYTHRAIILASLAKGTSTLSNCLLSDDTLYTVKAMQLLGVKINSAENLLEIIGSAGDLKVNPDDNLLFLGNSGTSLRLLASVAALVKGEVVLYGNERLRERPMLDLLLTLNNLGIKAQSLINTGCLPIKITGAALKGGSITVSGKISSQFISSLLLISPFAKNGMKIIIKGKLISCPYVDITIDIMRKFGVEVDNNHYKAFSVKKGQAYKERNYEVEGDYSSASYFFAASAITGAEITVNGLNTGSVQGDRHFLDLMKKMGCQVKKANNKIKIRRKQNLTGIKVDMANYPDIVQSLCMVAACAKGKTFIYNISNLKTKETDRIEATAMELRKMKIKVQTTKDTMTIYGGQPRGSEIETHNDHRMAMSFAVLSLRAPGKTVINNAEVVSKSYPGFFQDLGNLGAKIKEEM